MIDRRKVCPVFLLIPFFRAANSRRKMRNKLRILTNTGRRRRQVLLVLTLVTSAIHFRAEVRPRPACSLPRPEGWFKLMLNAPIYNYDLYWREHSRMSRRTFQFVVNIVRNSVEKRDSRFREAASIEKRVAVALWRECVQNCCLHVWNWKVYCCRDHKQFYSHLKWTLWRLDYISCISARDRWSHSAILW